MDFSVRVDKIAEVNSLNRFSVALSDGEGSIIRYITFDIRPGNQPSRLHYKEALVMVGRSIMDRCTDSRTPRNLSIFA